MGYRHTQIGHLLHITFIAVLGLFIFMLKFTPTDPLAVLFMLSILFILSSFLTLTVKIERGRLGVKFGWGIYRKSYAIKDILSARAVRNKWYYGWGIRFVLWPRMWVFNVSGFDAVEIELSNRRIIRIGTDEPQRLLEAVNAAKR